MAGALLRRVADVRPGEGRALALSFLYFFFLLTAYYVLRPLRDERGVAAGLGSLPWLFTATFAVMLAVVPLWSALVARVSRARLLPWAYRFFLLNLAVFWVLFQIEPLRLPVARAFYVWTSVFNYLAVSVFWSFMADLFRPEQGKRLFGVIAAGGSAGALLGPLATALLVERIGIANLLLLAAVLLEGAARCIGALARWRRQAPAPEASAAPADLDRPVGGGALEGVRLVFSSPYLLGICGYVVFVALAGTVGYFLQMHLVAAAALAPAARTALFARLDLAVNALSALLQALVAGRLLARAGVRFSLALVPPLSTVGFGVLAAAPTLAVSSTLYVLRRALGFGIANPALQVLFTVLEPEQKYKSKAFIDTVVSRGGDAVHAWLAAALIGGLGVAGTALASVPFGLAWLLVALFVGTRYGRLRG